MSFGRLERAKAHEPMSEINVTPLVDVMLVLLVIFIITAPLLASSIKLNLPQTEAAKPQEAPKFITVVIDKEAKVYLDDKPIEPAQLAERFTQAAKANKETEVQLRADEGVAYGRVVEVIGAAQKAGLSRIGFVADAKSATQPTAKP